MSHIKIEGVGIQKDRFIFDRDGSRKKKIRVLHDINVRVEEGICYAIIGPSGAGKTTLLKLINRLDDPTDGKIFYDGRDIREMDLITLRKKVAFVFQAPSVFPGTVEDNLITPLKIHKLPAHGSKDKIRLLLDVVGLERDLLQRNAQQLSVGQQQRVVIARSLMLDPEIVLLDEPTANLDPITARNFLESVKEIHEKFAYTVIIVTHRMRHAKFLADEVMVMKDGRVVEEDSVTKIFKNPEHEVTRQLLEQDEIHAPDAEKE